MSMAQWVDDQNKKNVFQKILSCRLVGWWATKEDTHLPDRLCTGEHDIRVAQWVVDQNKKAMSFENFLL